MAVICTNGHVLNAAALAYPDPDAAFCDRCGSPALSRCPSCAAPIRGEFHISGMLSLSPYSMPAYCHACGSAYPWTEERLAGAALLADEMDQLSTWEREQLKESIRAVACDAPTSAAHVARLKRLLARVGDAAADSFRQILVDIVTEAVRKALWG